MPSRRNFLASLVSRPAIVFFARRPGPATESEESVDEKTIAAGTYQFGLRTLLVLVTVVCVWLGLLRADLRMGLFFGFVAVIAVVELYRARIRTTLGDANYSRIATVLRCVGGALAGAIVGAIGGLITAIFLPSGVTDFGSAIKIGIGIGVVLGVVYPRIAMTLILFVPPV